MPPERDDQLPLADDSEWELWEAGSVGREQGSLVELVNRVLDRGVVIHGDITLSVAGVDLVYVGLTAVLTSVSTARKTLGKRVGVQEFPKLGS